MQAKIFAMVAIILAVLTAVILFFADRDVEHAMVQAEKRSGLNTLHLVEMRIREGYRSLLLDKFAMIERAKADLERMDNIVSQSFEHFYELEQNGAMGRESAQYAAWEWMAGLEEAGREDFVVFDGNNRILYAPDPAMLERDISSIRDIRGQPLADLMRQEAMVYGYGSTAFRWLPGGPRKFGRFVHFDPWNWTVGAVVDIEAIEADVLKRLLDIEEGLQNSIAKIRVAQSGYMFIFTGDQSMVAGPDDSRVNLSMAVNQDTGNLLLGDLALAAQSGQPAQYAYTVQGSDGPERWGAYVTYYKTLDWYIASSAPMAEIRAPARKLAYRLAAVIGGVFVFSLIAAFILVDRISRPLARLAGYARELPYQDFTQAEAEEPAIADMPDRYRDEVGRLAQSFVFMEQSLRERIRELMESTAARERIQSELNVARDIQMGLLPKIFPPFPEREDLDLYALLTPAKEVGGDLYNFFFLDETRLCFAVGDVSGKGVPAALFMAITQTLIKNSAELKLGPGGMMTAVNDVLAKDNPNSMFVTLVIGVIDLADGHVVYANGGHNYPIVVGPNREAAFLKGITGPVAGAMEGLEYGERELELALGETLLIYSDGVTEAMNTERALYSDDKLLETVRSLAGCDSTSLVGVIYDSVKAHAGEEEQSDDITILCLRRVQPETA